MKSNHFDIIAVGAGIMGVFYTYHAAMLGKRVLLLEKDRVPVNATVRNFGQVVPSGLASDWLAYGLYSTHLYKKIQREFDIGIRQNGSVYLASDPDEQQLIHELKRKMDDRGYAAQLLTQSQCLKKWPALKANYVKEGLFFPEEVSAEPETTIHRIILYLESKFNSVTYQPQTTVLTCTIKKGLVHISTDRSDSFTATKVVICNGSEFKILFSDLFRKSDIVISKLNMLRSTPQPQLALEGNILTGLTIRRYESFQECPSFAFIKTPPELEELQKWGIHILFKKAIDGSVILGDSHEYATVDQPEKLGFEINQHINNLMLKEAARIITMDNFQIASSWAGYYSQHPEKDLVEIDIEDKIHIRTAIGGKGMTSAAGYTKKSIEQFFE